MGPTNIALVKLFRADQALREAQERLDAASKNVRVQERRVNDLTEKHKAAQLALRTQQSKAGQLDLDMKSRDAHIEKLRTHQQSAKTNKEYQAFLIEINTAKVDRGKVEEEAMKMMEVVDTAQTELAGLAAGLETERAKLQTLKDQSGATVAALKAEVEETRPARDAAAAALPPKALAAFERLADHHDGEAMAAIARPDRRREEYVCTSCNMDLVTDVYNKLHSRDELVFCPSCRRILYIPEDLPVENAIKTRATPKSISSRLGRVGERVKDPGVTAPPPPPVVIEQRAKGKLGDTLTKAQGETVRSANAAGETPVECEVFVDGRLAGIYKGQTPEHLERAAKYYLGEAGIPGEVRVVAVQTAGGDDGQPDGGAPDAAAPTESTESITDPVAAATASTANADVTPAEATAAEATSPATDAQAS